MTVSAVLFWVMTMPRAIADAGSSCVRLEAKASIEAWVKFGVQQRVATYTVTKDDLARGFIDIDDAATVRLRSNEKRSYRMHLPNPGGRPVLLRASEAASHYRPSLEIAHPLPGSLVEKVIDCRILLPGDAAPGLYLLPFSFVLASV